EWSMPIGDEHEVRAVVRPRRDLVERKAVGEPADLPRGDVEYGDAARRQVAEQGADLGIPVIAEGTGDAAALRGPATAVRPGRRRHEPLAARLAEDEERVAGGETDRG